MARALVKNASNPNPVNLLINGGMDYWQRGTSITNTTTGKMYTADRWCCFTNNSSPTPALVVARSTDCPVGFQYSAKIQRSAGNTNTTDTYFRQAVESVDVIPMQGKTMTVSFWAKAGANYSAPSSILNFFVRTGTGLDEDAAANYTGAAIPLDVNVTLTTSWQRFSRTVFIASSVRELLVDFRHDTVGTAGADDSFYLTGVMLTEGVAAPASFYRNQLSAEAEFGACQRFYETSAGLGVSPAAADYWSSAYQATQTRHFVVFQTSKRTDQFLITTWNDVGSSSNSSALNYSVNTVGNFSDGGQGNRRLYGFQMATPSAHVSFPVRFGWSVSAEL